MNLREFIRECKPIMLVYENVARIWFCMLTCISPEINTKARYRQAFKRRLDLSNPTTLNEKILWLKLNKYMKNPLVIQCADKYAVREYVKKSGCGDILNDLYGVYESADQIEWDALPQQFVLKWNFGAGMNIVCTDRSKLNEKKVKRTLNKWRRCKQWLTHSEMQYKYMPKRIVCERLLNANNNERNE